MNVTVEITEADRAHLNAIYEQEGFNPEFDFIEGFLRDKFISEIRQGLQSKIRQDEVQKAVEVAKAAPLPVDLPESDWLKKGDVITFEGKEYEVIQAHRPQTDWRPDTTPALYKLVQIAEPGDDYPQWVQPTGGHDAYNIGDRVVWNGNNYESTINANVWAPNVTGWVLI
jgi:hypothetical protein